MSANYSVFTRIMGEEAISPLFRKVGEAAKAAFRPVEAFNRAVNDPKTTALGRVGAAADSVAGKFRAGLGSITSWLPALGALGAAGSFAGLIAMTRRAAEGYDGLSTAALKLGVSTSALSVWRYGAKLANVESEALEKGLVKLNKTMYDAATGKNKDVALLFQRMKIPLRDAQGNIKGAANSLEDIAEAFKNTGNASTREAMAIALFGRAGADLIPFLIKGRAGIAELRAEMKRFSGLTDEHREGLEHLDKSYKQLDKAGSGLASRLSAAVAPSLARVVDWTTDWIAANRELIAQSLERKIAKIGLAFDVVKDSARSLLSVPVVGEFLKTADAGTAFDIALGGLGLTLAGPLFAAVQVVTAAVWRLNAAMYANPWVLLAAGIAFAAYEVYAHWGGIKEWFGEQMDAIRAASERGFGAEALEVFTRFNGFSLIAQAANAMVKDLTGIDLGRIARAWLTGMIAAIKSLLPDLDALWAKLDPVFAWVSRNTVALQPGVPAGYEGIVPGYAAAFGVPAPPSPGSPAAMAPAAPQKSELTVKVEIVNTPQGAIVTVDGKAISRIERSVGYSMADNT